jgi:hypothetical protein
MRLIQYLDGDCGPAVGWVEESAGVATVSRVSGFRSTYDLARAAMERGESLETVAQERAFAGVPYTVLLRENRLLTPLAHPDPARCLVSGTGLTHLGSADTRDGMHRKLTVADAQMSDSMRMFKWGIEGGKPADGPGVQPEWFYKGDGDIVVRPGHPLCSPHFAPDGGEEPELVGLYVVGSGGVPYRLGFAIGNEFSDHVTERKNYLYLAHSKLRQCAIGPELRTGPLAAHLEGYSRIRRRGELLWEKPFLTGEANMCHSLANLEYHHFKYAAHRRPGDVHLHFFGTATLSCADGIKTEPGDEFVVDLPALGAALINSLEIAPPEFEFDAVRSFEKDHR